MPCAELQFSIWGTQFKFAQPEACHGGSVLGMKVGLIGLVTRIGRHPILLSRERMDDARFESSTGKGMFG